MSNDKEWDSPDFDPLAQIIPGPPVLQTAQTPVIKTVPTAPVKTGFPQVKAGTGLGGRIVKHDTPVASPDVQVIPRTAPVPQPQAQTPVQAPNIQVSEGGIPKLPEMPETESTAAEHDAHYYGIHVEMPSGMTFYDFKKMSARPYRLAEMFKLGGASKSGRIRPIVEAVAASLDRHIDRLIMMDFIYLCYWLRATSYKRNPFTINWECQNVEHYQEVAVGKKVKGSSELAKAHADTLKNQHVIDKDNLKIKRLDEPALTLIAQELVDMGVGLYGSSVADFLELEENGDEWDDETLFISKYAALLSVHHGKRLIDRISYLRNLSATDIGTSVIELLDVAAKIIGEAGVNNIVTATCDHCKAEQSVLLEMDLQSFFPL